LAKTATVTDVFLNVEAVSSTATGGRFALVITLLDVPVPLLFAGFGSVVAAVDEAELVNTPPDEVTVTVKLDEAPTGKFVIAGHVTTFPDGVPPPEALTKLVLAGKLSLVTTLLADAGPRFVSVIV
jgi:hypothetical protein